MKFLIDTNSWLIIVRYYLAFDKNNRLSEFLKASLENRSIVLIDKVFEECKFQAKGIITKELPFLNEKSLHVKTTEVLPYPKFYNLIENQFCDSYQRNRLEDYEFENAKNEHIESADVKLVLLAKELMVDNEVTLITEETRKQNDSKPFCKIPLMCDELNITCISIADFLVESELKISIQ
ncbi:MAG: DUF4411 family protein [Bacteroidetes bacterium]|jgi:hypothetical protein|nr:DUF4411 family protein [Bacteroidota bacterium]